MIRMIERIHNIGIVPVVSLKNAEDAFPLGRALCEGGLPCAEVTFRTDAAEESIRRLTQSEPELLVGAGTVLTVEQADCAIRAGAKFIVSPGLNPKVVRHCREKKITVIPGVFTPSEMEQALELGLEAVKFFPAEPGGGLSMIRAMGAAYTKLRFMPTGGINIGNVSEYLKWDRVLACGGSWMVKDGLIEAGRYEEIAVLCREAADLVKRIRG